GNVTIFGESGGGRKVAALLAMPPAQGLFHRAIIESGPGIRVNEREYATQFARAFIQECGVSGAEDLQELPVERILAAQGAMAKKMPSSNARGGFRPVIDPVDLPAHPFDPVGPEMSASVPVMVGFNRTEATLFLANDKEVFDLDEGGLVRRTERIFKEDAPRVLERMGELYPHASPSDLYLLIHTQFLRYPIDSIKLAERRAAQGGAPVYLYRFDWQTPARFGQLRTPHALEIPFVFDNTELGAWRGFTRGTSEAAALAAKVSATWAAFARTGSPNAGGLPEWRPYVAGSRATMLINDESALVGDPQREERELFEEIFFGAHS
ncbi:MAG TPA: carboxylesterase family protein, partial [Tepidiformaceae bacterium]|nr:carboxylesterase family protein [Tepidiformaceae bacterium]